MYSYMHKYIYKYSLLPIAVPSTIGWPLPPQYAVPYGRYVRSTVCIHYKAVSS